MATPPYDDATTIINATKVRLNDVIETLQPIGGKLLKNTNPFGQQTMNNAWRKLQEYLGNLGYSGLKQQTVFTGVPAVSTLDPISQVSIGFSGYFDGTGPQGTPFLPQNLIRPYELWERQSGTTDILTEMDLVLNGLPPIPKLMWNRQYEWRNDTLYMPGARVPTDISMRFGGYLADFVDITSNPGPNQIVGPWFGQPVPIMRCLDAFADYACREIFIALKDPDGAAALQASAEANARLILNRDTAMPKEIAKASEYGRMQDRYTPNTGADTQPVKR